MASVPQSPEWNSRSGPAGEDLSGIERWFLRRGVPQFVYGYLPVDSMPILFYLLLIVVASDLAIGPWVSRNRWFLLVAPAAFVLLGLCLRLFVKASIIGEARYLLGELTKGRTVKSKRSYMSFKAGISCLASHPIRLSRLLLGVCLLGFLVFLLGRDRVWSSYSVDFVVITVLLWSAARLFGPDVWEGTNATLRERQRRLYLVGAVAIVAFALEGSIVPNAMVLMGDVTITPASLPVPQALAALLVTAIIVVQSRGLIAASSQAGDGVDQQPSEAGELGQQHVNHYFPALPLLILVFCAETAILPSLGPIWIAATIPLAALASLPVLSRRRQDKPIRKSNNRRLRWVRTPQWLTMLASHPRVRSFINHPSVRVLLNNPSVKSLVILYIFVCPMLVGALAASDENNPADPKSAFLLAFAINLFYLILVVSIAVFGLNGVARWASKEAWKDLRQVLSNLGRGLSILVVFAALALLTAETWETMREISTTNYLGLVGAILGLAGAFHLITSLQHVTKTAAFGTWSEVRAAAMPEDDDSLDPEIEIKALLDRNELSHLDPEDPKCKAPKHRLGVLETANSVIVMMTYGIFFFFPVTIVAAIVFLTFGYVTVPDKVAANWIAGDRASQTEINEIKSLPPVQQPWIRVGLLLTAFAILYLVVEILSDPDKRKIYFESANKAVRQRLAVRLAYCEVRARRNLPQTWRPTHFRWITMPVVAAHRTGGWQPPTTSPTRESKTPIGRPSRSGPTMGQTADSPDQPAVP
jgi:hypothetical protein